MIMGKKNATIVDVAREAGVSVATVSRVVNGNYPVKPRTKEVVTAAIEKLHYVPNVQARELNRRSSHTIGVAVPGLGDISLAEMVDSIEAAMGKERYAMLLGCTRNDPGQEQDCLRLLCARNVAGLIVASPQTGRLPEDFYREMAERIPLVFVNGQPDIEAASYVNAAGEAQQGAASGKKGSLLGQKAAELLLDKIRYGASKRVTLE